MKRFRCYCLFFLLGLVAAVSCNKNSPESDGTFVSADDSGVLLANLVIMDDDDNIIGNVTGFSLNEANPGEITIHAESLENAQEIFRSWITLDAVVTEGADGSISWQMTDIEKKSQGTAVLKPGGEKGAVAHVELPAGFPVITKILFVPSTSMPENAELDFADALEQFYFGNVINVLKGDFPEKDLKHGSGAMVVIREYDQDTNTSGILLALPQHTVGDGTYWGGDVFDEDFGRSRKLAELQGPIGKTYRQYRKYIDPILTRLNYVNGDRWFSCTNDSKYGNRTLYNLVSNADDGKYYTTSFWNMTWGKTHYECWAYFFTLEKDGNGGYKVVLK
jgi:hypothetical protein